VHTRLRVGIVPASEHRARARLWAALEEAYAVRFEGWDAGGAEGSSYELDAAVVLGEGDGAVADLPSLTLPSLMLHTDETPGGTARPLALASEAALARALRGAQLSDAYTGAHGTDAGAGALGTMGAAETVLATLDGVPVWVCERAAGVQRHRAACAPTELYPHEALRERLRPGRCLALLALAHFLAQLTASLRQPARPPLRAAFLIDDPNLHLPRYGHIDYAQLLCSAHEHGYHVAVAMVPLDARLAHPRAVRIFREGAAHLSLCIHGNDHDGAELGRIHGERQAVAVVAQALRRSAAFERRTGLAVDRVMVPPHERLSEPVARALYACGYQAFTATRPYPWLADTLERSWLEHPPETGPLVGWNPFDVVAGSLPVLLRADFLHHPREDLVLRAFLGQPLILYGHHDLLADGPDALARAAAEINRLGEVHWSALGAMAPERPLAPPAPEVTPFTAIPAPPRRVAPLLRRIASEGRDRTRARRPKVHARSVR
jgi:hypothetical protein